MKSGVVSPEPSLSELPILDPHPLQELLEIGAGVELVQELIGILREDVPLRMALMQSGLEARDTEKVMMEAHQLKGSSGNLGLLRLAELARQIEAEARAGRLEQVPAWLKAIPGALEEGLAALGEAFPS
jgi:HPt (histidine-containing phosphotransfer) domain-containing protein